MKLLPLLLVFTVLLSPLTSLADVADSHSLGLARSSFPSVHAQQLIRALNLFPESDANIIASADSSSAFAAGKRIVEKRFNLPNVVGESGVSVEDLGHHAGYIYCDRGRLNCDRGRDRRRTERLARHRRQGDESNPIESWKAEPKEGRFRLKKKAGNRNGVFESRHRDEGKQIEEGSREQRAESRSRDREGKEDLKRART